MPHNVVYHLSVEMKARAAQVGLEITPAVVRAEMERTEFPFLVTALGDGQFEVSVPAKSA